MTYAERELSPLGFILVEGTENKVVFSLGHLKLQFDCCCPAFPNIKALGCPLHHSGLGSSWPVEEAKKISTNTTRENESLHTCGLCGAEYPTTEALYAHQQDRHDPDGIMFSEIGLPK